MSQLRKKIEPDPSQPRYLRSEPWVFVIDRNGVIRSEIEGPFGVDELTRDVEQVAGGGA